MKRMCTVVPFLNFAVSMQVFGKMAKRVIVIVLIFGSALAGPALSAERSLEGRIVGGSEAVFGQFPHQVSIRSQSSLHICGGSILSKYWVVTAAHCVYDEAPKSLQVLYGTVSLRYGGMLTDVDWITFHEDFNKETKVNDIALVRLGRGITFNNNIQPANFASAPPVIGAPCQLAGWGFTSYPSTSNPDKLQYISLKTITVEDCRSALPGYPINSTNVCTREALGRGACEGDAGSALICGNIQYGIGSWGIPCGKGYPDDFVSVGFYRTWIKAKTGI